MSGPKLGTLEWVRETGGVMNRRERARLIAKGISGTLRTLPARRRHSNGLGAPSGLSTDLEEIPVPDSADATKAEELCAVVSSPFLLNHCHRTYLWGMLLGRVQGLRPDPELLYVAAILHDLGLTERYAEAHPGMPCFAGQGAEAALAWALERGWEEERAWAIAEAISIHMNVAVEAEHGPEAQLLQQGASLDVIGMRHWMLSPETIAAVVDRHPRADLKRDFTSALCAAARPGTRADLFHNRLRAPLLIARSQFAE